MKVWPRFCRFFHRLAEIHEFVLALFCVNFRYVLNFFKSGEIKDGGSKMAYQMTLLPSKLVSSCRTNPGLSNQCVFYSTEIQPTLRFLSNFAYLVFGTKFTSFVGTMWNEHEQLHSPIGFTYQ